MDATPTKDEVGLVQRLARLAVTEGGLRLRPFRLSWYTGRGELWPVVCGYIERSRPVTVHLRVGLSHRNLASVVFHELCHVHDLLNPVDPPLMTGELETRAEAFEEQMMQRCAARLAGWR